MTKRATLADRKPLLQPPGQGADLFFQKTTHDEESTLIEPSPTTSPREKKAVVKIRKQPRGQQLVKLIAYITPEQSEYLELVASDSDISKAEVVRKAIEFFIENAPAELK